MNQVYATQSQAVLLSRVATVELLGSSSASGDGVGRVEGGVLGPGGSFAPAAATHTKAYEEAKARSGRNSPRHDIVRSPTTSRGFAEIRTVSPYQLALTAHVPPSQSQLNPLISSTDAPRPRPAAHSQAVVREKGNLESHSTPMHRHLLGWQKRFATGVRTEKELRTILEDEWGCMREVFNPTNFPRTTQADWIAFVHDRADVVHLLWPPTDDRDALKHQASAFTQLKTVFWP